MKTFFEELGIQYEEHEDGLLYPILKLPQEEEPRYSKYGQLRLQPPLYNPCFWIDNPFPHLVN